MIARFFGIPFDVRHVTLSTGTLALAAARFGTSSFGKDWFYYAMAGIGVTFVLNLGVSFSISAFVALRAYDVRGREQLQLVRYLLRQMVRSPLRFLVPIERDSPRSRCSPLCRRKNKNGSWDGSLVFCFGSPARTQIVAANQPHLPWGLIA